jgi:GNAT superfamily N-acetyltransferase
VNITVSRLILSQLDQATIEAYKALTEPKYYCCLLGEHPDGVLNTISIAISAQYENQPVGLILANCSQILRMTEMHSIFVAEPFRGPKLNIAPQMLALLETELIPLGCMVLTFSYNLGEPETHDLEHLLLTHGWEKPRLFMISCHFDQKFNPPWLNTELPLPTGFSEFPWPELTAQERAKLQYREEQGMFRPEISPFGKNEHIIEPLNSLGLRYKGEVVGWMITHRIDPDTIRYSALYIHKEFQIQGIALRLLRDSIQIQLHATLPPFAVLDVNVDMVDRTWLNFIKRKLIPFAFKVTYKNQIWRYLKKPFVAG